MPNWGKWDSTKCPRCNTDKSTQHVIQWQADDNIEQYKESFEPLKEWLKQTTLRRIASAVRTHMNAKQQNIQVNGFWTSDKNMRRLSGNHDELGIRSFDEGFLALDWKATQERHYGGEDTASRS